MIELYYKCPYCDKKLARIENNSKSEKVYVWCKECRQEREINITEPRADNI